MSEIPTQSNSKSLWNYSLYRGWTVEDVEVFKIALMKYGFGQWDRIIRSNCLPGKTPIQMYHQTQRLIGQQSLSNFKGLHLDLEKVFIDNQNKNNAYRKNNFIINAGDNQTGKMITESLQENKEKYGLPPEYYKNLKLPRTLSNSIGPYMTIKQITEQKNNLTLTEKVDELRNLIECMKKKLEILDYVELGKKRQREISHEDEEERQLMELHQNLTPKKPIQKEVREKNVNKLEYPYRKIFDKGKYSFLNKRSKINKRSVDKTDDDISDYEVIRIKKSANGYELLLKNKHARLI